MRDIAVFGAGYIGLVTGACLAELGHKVTVRDVRPERIEALRRGEVPICEPGLADLLAKNSAENSAKNGKERLRFTLDAREALQHAEVAYVCVDTPPLPSGDADLSRVWSVVQDLREAPQLAAVIMKSTVPVGVGEQVRNLLDDAGLGHVGYASNPEFTAEGSAVQDFMSPDRIVIGAADAGVSELVADLYGGIEGPVQKMSIASAEMAKLASNALLATKISFINEIAAVCEATGADVGQVAAAVGMDHRLGTHFLKAGLGYGGSCFPKDSRALRAMASNSGSPLRLLSVVIEVNDLQPRRAVARLKERLGGLRGRRVALLGLTFKPGTDDMREAPSAIVAGRLLAEGAEITGWDPMARLAAGAPWDQVERKNSVVDAVAGCDAAMIVTEWPELRDVDWGKVAEVMANPLLFDGRNLLDSADQVRHGFTSMGVGRATVLPE